MYKNGENIILYNKDFFKCLFHGILKSFSINHKMWYAVRANRKKISFEELLCSIIKFSVRWKFVFSLKIYLHVYRLALGRNYFKIKKLVYGNRNRQVSTENVHAVKIFCCKLHNIIWCKFIWSVSYLNIHVKDLFVDWRIQWSLSHAWNLILSWIYVCCIQGFTHKWHRIDIWILFNFLFPLVLNDLTRKTNIVKN